MQPEIELTRWNLGRAFRVSVVAKIRSLRATRCPDTSAAGAELELAELKGKLGAFEEQLGSCFSTLESLQAQTSTLPAMKSLLADLVKASAKNGDVSC